MALAFAAALSGCSPKRSGDVLARVGDSVITTDDFKKEVQWRLIHHRPIPEKAALLEEMIAGELALQKAKTLGLQTNSNVQRSYNEMLIGELKDQELVPKVESVKISAQEVQAAYDHDIAKYTRPSKTRLSIIFMKVDRKMTAEQKAAVEARMSDADKAAHALPDVAHGFGAVAMNFSEDQSSRYRGGDIGWYDESEAQFRWPKEVVQAGIGLTQTGQISPVIRAGNGLFLVMKTDLRNKSLTPLANVSSSIQRRLVAEKKQQVEVAFAKDLRASTRVQTDPIALSLFDYPTTTVAQVEEKFPPALPRSK